MADMNSTATRAAPRPRTRSTKAREAVPMYGAGVLSFRHHLAALKGLTGEPYRHCGFDGWLFRDVSGWEWRFGEERASSVSISACWRPAVGTIKVDPVFSTNNTRGGGQQ